MKNTNNNLKWYVAAQDCNKDRSWGWNHANFMKLNPNAKESYDKAEQTPYAEHATALASHEEAQMYAFALNFRENREYSQTYYFPVQVDLTFVPHIPTDEEEENNNGSELPASGTVNDDLQEESK